MRRSMLIFLACQIAFAAPTTITYSTYLTDLNKKPRAILDFVSFRLYSDSANGTKLWEEDHRIVAPNGFVSVVLGAKTGFPLRQLAGTDKLYLEMQIGSESPFPRQKITGSFFAFGSAYADSAGHAALADSALRVAKADTSSYAAASGKALSLADSIVTPAKISKAGATKNQAITYDGTQVTWALPAVTTAGPGITRTLNSETETLSISFSGTGSATTVARSDHSHSTQYHSKAHVDSLENRIAALEAKLQYISCANQNIYIDGANLCIRNGQGKTDTINGFGNLIVGYNEARATENAKTGSHNLVVGPRHNFTSYGGLIAGFNNSIAGPYSSVSGGQNNVASGSASSVGGGQSNTTEGSTSSVSGGLANSASAIHSHVSGGAHNTTSGPVSSISGGANRTASGNTNWVAGSLMEAN